MGKKSRTKGHGFEREVAAVLREVYPDAGRGWQSRDGGVEPDVDGCMFRVECKRIKRIAACRFWDQAMADAKKAAEKGDNRDSVVVFREDRGPAMAMLLLSDFVDLLKGEWP